MQPAQHAQNRFYNTTESSAAQALLNLAEPRRELSIKMKSLSGSDTSSSIACNHAETSLCSVICLNSSLESRQRQLQFERIVTCHLLLLLSQHCLITSANLFIMAVNAIWCLVAAQRDLVLAAWLGYDSQLSNNSMPCISDAEVSFNYFSLATHNLDTEAGRGKAGFRAESDQGEG